MELLFGERYNRKFNKETGEIVRLRPADAACFGLQPVKTTGNRSRPWARVLMDGDEDKYGQAPIKKRVVFSHTVMNQCAVCAIFG